LEEVTVCSFCVAFKYHDFFSGSDFEVTNDHDIEQKEVNNK
jgi:hypothetical protein